MPRVVDRCHLGFVSDGCTVLRWFLDISMISSLNQTDMAFDGDDKAVMNANEMHS